MGALAVIVTTHMIENIWKIMEGSVQLSLYNIKAGITTTKNSVKMVLYTIQYDIISEVLWAIKNSPIKFRFVHVYRHQDESVHFNELP